MVDIPLNKAIIAVKAATKCGYECKEEGYQCPILDQCCHGCVFDGNEDENAPLPLGTCDGELACDPFNREDGIKAIFKLVDYPGKEPGHE